ncbi:MAG TPA: curli production assembly/transport protein CsgE [Burkholderiaceae bacterium]|nr:curli production assembly/transport protein CsgE [Burkholderiaceae bacterium]
MLRPRIQLGVLVLALTVLQPALAKTRAPAKPAGPTVQGTNLDAGSINNEPLGGLIINRTMTVLGFDFYRSFSEVWQAVHPDSKFNITVYERPTAQYGSEIWVSYRDIRVYHTFLSPARSGVRKESKLAVETAYTNITEIDAERKQFKSADLGPEEM